MALIRLVLVFAIGGCNPGSLPNPSARPVVRADDGATASFTIIACPPTDARAAVAAELIQILSQHEELVTARDGGNARLVINSCPGGVVVQQPVRR